jgi:hypothetical protein
MVPTGWQLGNPISRKGGETWGIRQKTAVGQGIFLRVRRDRARPINSPIARGRRSGYINGAPQSPSSGNLSAMSLVRFQLLVLTGGSDNLYSILIALICGFASLNILHLLTRPVQPVRGLTFGEMLAITGAVISLLLLGVDMLHVYHVFPIKLQP